MKKRYIITGAAGHLGGTILRLLKDKADEIWGLLLPGESPPTEGENIRYVCGDVCRPASLEALFHGGAQEVIVIHTAGLISIAGTVSPQVRAVNVGGTANMIELAKRYDVDRFVYVSSVHAIPEPPLGETIQETERFSFDLVTGGYAKTKAEATQLVLDAAGQGFPAVIVHPSGIIGPFDPGKNHLTQLVADYLRGKLPLCVKGGYDFVDVRDVAQGCLLAASHGETGRCYILSGHYMTIYELLACAGRFAGRKPPRIVPMPLARLTAPAIQAIAQIQHRRPLYTRYSLHALTSNSAFSSARAQAELGYRPRGAEETIRDMVQWLTCDLA